MRASSYGRQAYQTSHENKVREINEKIRSWGQLPWDPYELIDSKSFTPVSSGVGAFLKKEGDRIKIHTTNVGDLEISEEELGDRIGTGLDFLDLLSRRLDAFKDLIFQRVRDNGPNV
jgi:hypothetical protein